jgi:ADP-ribose pyrophosphatase YjhB (NUDIX family)
MTTRISSLATGIREFVPFYQNAFKQTWNNINDRIDVSKLQDVVRTAGGLRYHEREELVHMLDREIRPISRVFGRRFERFESGLINVDCFANRDGKVLVHLRDGKYCLTGGGFVDPDETCMEAAKRELYEESGGCQFENVKLIGFRDDPKHNISALFEGTLEGTPRDNMEASGFALFDQRQIIRHPFFAGHDKLLQFYFQPNQTSSTIPFLSGEEPLPAMSILRGDVDQSFITQALQVVARELNSLSVLFKTQFAPRVDHEIFRDSLDRIGHGWSRKKVEHENDDWDDNAELGMFLDPVLDMSIRISSLFNTHVNTGECGKLNLAAVVEHGDKIVMFQPFKGDRVVLPCGIHRHGERFPEALTRILQQRFGIEIEPRYDLFGFSEDPGSRTLLFRVKAKSITEKQSILVDSNKANGLLRLFWDNQPHNKV